MLTAGLQAQYVFHGKVADEQLIPLEAVSVSIEHPKLVIKTDSAGSYSFSSASSKVAVHFSHIGYEPLTIIISHNEQPVTVLSRSSTYLSETIVNAYEHNRLTRNIPAAVSILSKAALERYGNESFVPAINTVPGVKMDERSPGSYRLSIRGNLLRSTFGVRNVKVYWNGIPFTDANGNTYFNELSLSNVNKIEILKGAAGSMYGAGTGGVILISNYPGTVPQKNISMQAVAGSYGSFNASASYNQSSATGCNTISFSHQQSDGYRRQTNMHRDVANYTGLYELSSRQQLRANIFYSDLYYQTPGGLTLAEMKADPRQARPAAGVFNSAEAQQAALYLKTMYAGLGYDYTFNEHWKNTTSLYVSNTNFKNPTIRNYERKTEQGIGFRTLTKYSNKLFTAVIGAEYQYGFTNTSTFGNRFGNADTLQFHDEIDARQYNMFFQAEAKLPADLSITAGISYNNFHYGFIRLSQLPSFKESSDFKGQFAPRIAVLKKTGVNSSAYISVSKGFSPPSIDEVHASDGNFNRQLLAETAVNYEAGFKTNWFKNRLVIDAALYYAGLRNTIVSRRDISGADYFVNAGNTRQWGLEISSQYYLVNSSRSFIKQARCWANYTYINARFSNYTQGSNKYDGNRLTGTPPNTLAAGIDVQTSIGVYCNSTYNYTDHIPLNDANSYFSEAYNLLHIRLGYAINPSKKIAPDIFIAWSRSFNNPYGLGNDLNATGNRFFNPSAPQNFYAGCRLKFILK